MFRTQIRRFSTTKVTRHLRFNKEVQAPCVIENMKYESNPTSLFFPLSSMIDSSQIISSKTAADTHFVKENEPVIHAIKTMVDANIGSVLVENDQNQITGILSERDYLRKIILKGRKSSETNVAEVMTSQVHFVGSNATLEECLILFNQYSFRHFPVSNIQNFGNKTRVEPLNRDGLLGLFSVRDVIKQICSTLSATDYDSYLEDVRKVGNTNVKDFLNVGYHTAHVDETVFDAIDRMASNNVGAVIVNSREGEKDIMGIFTERDYLSKIVLQGKNSKDLKIGEVMTPRDNIKFLSENAKLIECITHMAQSNVRQVPILCSNRINCYGLVGLTDLLKV